MKTIYLTAVCAFISVTCFSQKRDSALLTLNFKNSPKQTLKVEYEMPDGNMKTDTVLLLGNAPDEAFNLKISFQNKDEQALNLFCNVNGPGGITPVLQPNEHLVINADWGNPKTKQVKTTFYGSERTQETFDEMMAANDAGGRRVAVHDKYMDAIMKRNGDTALYKHQLDSMNKANVDHLRDLAHKTKSQSMLDNMIAASSVDGFSFTSAEFANFKQRFPEDPTIDIYAKIEARSEVKNGISVTIYDGVAINTMLKGFTLPDLAGKLHKLSQFKGKYVLVDFWASWCGPCRGETPFLKKALSQYGKNNFVIVSVSIDVSHQKWKAAIKEDHSENFVHLIDDKGWKSPVIKQYQISAVPINYLLDPSGKVMDKNLQGEDMLMKLFQLFDGKSAQVTNARQKLITNAAHRK